MTEFQNLRNVKENAEDERLHALLDEWQAQPRLSPQFELSLRRRIAEAEARRARGLAGWLARIGDALSGAAPLGWQRARLSMAGAAVALVVVLSVSVLLRSHDMNTVPPAVTQPVGVTASVPALHDLQVLDQDNDLLQNFDFISAQPAEAPHAEPESQY